MSGEATRGRILVIDDEESLRHALSRGLQRAGFACDAAATGREGVDRFGAGDYDAVLTDVRLPDLSGLDIVAVLLEMAPDVPVVVMTGYGTVDVAVESLRRGAKDFVEKPFSVEQVVQVLERAIRGEQASDAERALRAKVERQFAPERYQRVQETLEEVRGPAGAPAAPTAPEGAAPPGSFGLREAQRRFEVKYVEDLLAQTGGNVAAAARLAGISRPNFHKKLRTLGVDPARFKRAARRGRSPD